MRHLLLIPLLLVTIAGIVAFVSSAIKSPITIGIALAVNAIVWLPFLLWLKLEDE